MIAKSWLSRCWQWQIGGCVAIFGALSVGVSDRLLAQVVPDHTLGAERSVVTPNLNIRGIPSDRIDGGATRGANLFHSFSDFNVGQGRGVYFANPAGIENILTRVTGNNASNIFGRLGVLGGANLFLLNPNGIVFGQNATLDIQGSFVATTATRIQLGDSGYFSATQPQTSRLLAVSPGALFFDAVANQPGSIINQGNLSTGKHLTLAAGNLDLQGQLEALGDLTLQAQDTVKVRDTIASPFIATAGRNLTIQGNRSIDILALNHPLSKIESGGNLNLVSDGNISGDTHFESGGSLSMLTLSGTPGNFTSKFDPIIEANGDVLFGDYTGVALKVEATGSIQGGNIKITRAECVAGSAGCVGGIPTSDQDFATLTGSPSVILRAGLATVNTPNVPQNAGGTGFTATLGLPLGIKVGDINTSDSSGGNGGEIILDAAKGSISTGDLDSSSYSVDGNAGNGGAISLTAAKGSITAGDLYSSSYSFAGGDAGNGGAIDLTAANDIKITGNLLSSSYSVDGDAGNGGAISLTAANGSITADILNSYSESDSGKAGNGGAISLTAAKGSITAGSLVSSSYSVDGNAGNGGAISLTAANDINIKGGLVSSSYSVDGNAGNGGAISLTAAHDINIKGGLESYSFSNSGNAGNGGAISLTAAHDINIKGGLESYSSSNSGNAGNGGAISLTAVNGSITTDYLFSASPFYGNAGNGFYGNAGNGGAISLTAANDIFIKGNLYSYSISFSFYGNAGNGGAIRLTAANDIFIKGDLYSYSSSFGSGNAGNGGAIRLTAANDIFINGALYSYSYSDSGNATNGGTIDLSARRGTISGTNSFVNSFAASKLGGSGNGGNVTLETGNGVSGLTINTVASGGLSGNVTLNGLGDLWVANTNILTAQQVQVKACQSCDLFSINLRGRGQAGNVAVTSTGSLTFSHSAIQSDTRGGNPAGNITITSPDIVSFNNSQIISNTSSTGKAGSISIEAGQGITLVGMEDSSPVLSVETSSTGQPGSIIINTPTLTLSNNARITATATSTATNTEGGGSITINASTMDLAGVVGVFAETQGQTPAGTLTLQPYQNQSTLNLTLAPNSLVSASTSGSGKGGNLIVKAPEAINISGGGTLAVQTTGTGAAGDLRIDTKRLTLADGATISASTDSNNPQGTGGSININATDSFNLTNQASLRAQSTGAAPAGNITIHTGKLTANNGAIATSSDQSSGGDITIEARDIRLSSNSDITTKVNQGQGRGGDITLTAGSIVAFDDSDILAYAPGGTGGDITLKTPAFFGENYRPAPKGTIPSTLNGNHRVDVIPNPG